MKNRKPKEIRLHDNLYLKENRYKKPKEIFILLVRLIRKLKLNFNNKVKIADFGCSNGELSYYLKIKFPKADITGFDILPQLIKKAKKEVNDVSFYSGSVLNTKLVKRNSYDISLCIGVISIFDSFELSLNNLINWTKPNGKIYIFSFFNNYPFDVNIKFSKSENWVKYKPKFWERGYNVFSKKTISKFIKKNKKVKNFKFYDFNMKNNLKINHNDYLRSWTINTTKKKLLMNGTNLLHPFSVLEINLKR